MRFEWDPEKDRANRQKHGIGFDEASQLFAVGDDYLELFDAAHSTTEDRFIAIGAIRRGIVLVVWTERDEGVTRIISARFATSRERGLYRRYMENE